MNVKTLGFDSIEDLKREWTEKYVEVDASRPELKRFAGKPGRVITVNMSGRALVQFEEADGWGWGRYDIALPFLKLIPKPVPAAKEAAKHATPEKAKAEAEPVAAAAKKMSPIEMMRAKAAAKIGEKPSGDTPPATAPAAAEAKPAGKMSPIEIMRAKAAAKAAGAAPVEEAAATETAAGGEPKPAGKMSPLEMIRAKAAAKQAAESAKAEGASTAPTEANLSNIPPDAEPKKEGGLSKIEMIRQAAALKKAQQPPEP